MKITNRYIVVVLTLCALLFFAGTAFGGGQADKRNESIQHSDTREVLWQIRHGMEPTAAGPRSADQTQEMRRLRNKMQDRMGDERNTHAAYEIRRELFGGNGRR